ICGEEKEPEELSDLDGQMACLDCIAQANIAKNIPLEQLAAATNLNAPQRAPAKRSNFFSLIATLLFLAILAAGGFYLWRAHHRKQTLEVSIVSSKPRVMLSHALVNLTKPWRDTKRSSNSSRASRWSLPRWSNSIIRLKSRPPPRI